MMTHIFRTVFLLCSLATAVSVHAQALMSEQPYRRSSLYTILINHDDQQYASEIRTAFMAMPVPEKFNDHNLSVRMLTIGKKLRLGDAQKRQQMIISSENQNDPRMHLIDKFLINNQVASRMVGRWFNRDKYTGVCDMKLVQERGLYNASELDRLQAAHTLRGEALLQDAGEDLIGNTFVIFNDIRYIDKEKRAQIASGILRGLGAALGQVAGASVGKLVDNVADITESVKGFKVKVHSYLYQLVWDEETSVDFYENQYAITEADTLKRDSFEAARGKFKLKYVGRVESKGNETSVLGVNLDNPINMVRKACQRALDENIADLQHEYEEFRVKSPLISTNPITAYVGMKEGVTESTKFEVLERVEGKDGRMKYQRVGVIAPMKGMVWDNRYMAAEEGSAAASLGITTFRKVSGGTFSDGMLIREISN